MTSSVSTEGLSVLSNAMIDNGKRPRRSLAGTSNDAFDPAQTGMQSDVGGSTPMDIITKGSGKFSLVGKVLHGDGISIKEVGGAFNGQMFFRKVLTNSISKSRSQIIEYSIDMQFARV
jgi:hypothetical protein